MADEEQMGPPSYVPTLEETEGALRNYLDTGSSSDLSIFQQGKHQLDPNYIKALRSRAAIDAGDMIAERGGKPLPEGYGGQTHRMDLDRADPVPLSKAPSPTRPPGQDERDAEKSLSDLESRIQDVEQRARTSGYGGRYDREMDRYGGQLEGRKARTDEMSERFDELYDQSIAREAKHQEKQQLLRDRQGKAEKAFEGEIASLEKDLREFKIEPNRAFKNTWQSVGAAIAVAMGAFAQGLSGGKVPNTALQIINDAVRRDIEAQKTEFEKQRGLLTTKNNVYGRMLRKHGDARRAESEAFAAGMSVVSQRLNQMRSKAQSQNQLAAIEDAAHRAELEKVGHLESARNRAIQNELSGLGLEVQLARQKLTTAGKKKDDKAAKLATMRRLMKGVEKSWLEVGPWESGAASILQVFGESGPDILGRLGTDVNDYRKRRLWVAKLLTQFTDGGRPTDKDFSIILSLFPSLVAPSEAGQTTIRNLASQLETMMTSTDDGALRPGMVERWASSAGYDVDGMAREQKETVDGLKADMDRADLWKTFEAE